MDLAALNIFRALAAALNTLRDALLEASAPVAGATPLQTRPGAVPLPA